MRFIRGQYFCRRFSVARSSFCSKMLKFCYFIVCTYFTVFFFFVIFLKTISRKIFCISATEIFQKPGSKEVHVLWFRFGPRLGPLLGVPRPPKPLDPEPLHQAGEGQEGSKVLRDQGQDDGQGHAQNKRLIWFKIDCCVVTEGTVLFMAGRC